MDSNEWARLQAENSDSSRLPKFDHAISDEVNDTPIWDEGSVSVEVQTELHPIPSNIVEGYSWNEWDYRRRALILADVHKSATHSTQTFIQGIRTSQGSQTFQKKCSSVQTMRSVSTEAPRNQFYLYGLQGYHCSPTWGAIPPHVVELTKESIGPEDFQVKLPYTRQMAEADESTSAQKDAERIEMSSHGGIEALD